jgi:hypothetical protein
VPGVWRQAPLANDRMLRSARSPETRLTNRSFLNSRALSALFPAVAIAWTACSEAPPSQEDGSGGSASATGGGIGASGGSASGGTPGTGGSAIGGANTGGGLGSTGGGAIGGGGGSGGGAIGVGGLGNTGGSGIGGAPGGGSPGAGGGPAAASWADLNYMLNTGCAGCHSLKPGLYLVPDDGVEGANEALHSTLTSFQVQECNNEPLVTPGDPTKSAILKLLNAECTKDGQPFFMPVTCGAPPCFPQDWVGGISLWIEAGAPRQ